MSEIQEKGRAMGGRAGATGAAAPVTVIVPLFQGARFIAETLTSIQRQTLTPAEVIVVDDGSGDDGLAIVRNHPLRTRIIAQDHLGVAVARNRGLAESSTRWVTFIDQDDLWLPDRLERLFAWLGQHPEERIVATTETAFSTTEEVDSLTAIDPLIGGWASHLVPEATAYDDLCSTVDSTGSAALERHDALAMLRGPISKTTSFVAEAQLLRCAGGFAPHALAMDDYWLLVNAARLCPIAQVDQPTLLYRVHLGATSRSTRLALPFLSSAVALRLGGGLMTRAEGLRPGTTGPLHDHLLDELLRSDECADASVRRAAGHLAGLLWHGSKTGDLAKAEVRRWAGWLVPIVRRWRHRTQDHR